LTDNRRAAQRILGRLAAGEILIADGATGTYLQRRGLEPGGAPELLNATNPGLVRQMAKDYFDAGADIVLTNSFGGTKFRLRMHGLEGRVRELNRLAAEHARSAAPDGGFVAGSVGPSGGILESLGGDIREQELYDAYAEQIKALEEGGADAVVIETQFVLDEAKTAIKAARENTKLAVFASMTFDKGPRGYFTMAGQTPETAVRELFAAGADIAGTNCGNGIDRMVEIAEKMRAVTDRFLWVKSNAGIPRHVRGQPPLYPETPEYMAERFEKLARLPVNVLGGCCGTGPEHIRALAGVVRGGGLRAFAAASQGTR
jgi:5-methyltetrahydrofolate--homocysteine methyltransferase